MRDRLKLCACLSSILLAAASSEARADFCVTSSGGSSDCLREVDPNDDGTMKTPLILVHGWNAAGKPAVPLPEEWTNFQQYVSTQAALGSAYKLYRFEYYSNDVTIQELGGLLRDALDGANSADDVFAAKRLVLIAYSMGGLVARSFMQEYSANVGPFAGMPGGERVLRLITLATPHRGTPLANGPARDKKLEDAGVDPALIAQIDQYWFQQGGPAYNEVNRSDLHWDNTDGLMDYDTYPDEANPWLVQLNASPVYFDRTVAYGSIYSPSPISCFFNPTKYCVGSLALGYGFNLSSDGLVPVVSAFAFSSGDQQRSFFGYTHGNMVDGDGSTALFDTIRDDVLAVVPPSPTQVPRARLPEPARVL